MPETLEPIQLPDFARDLCAQQNCSGCARPLRHADVRAAGIRLSKGGDPFFYFEVRCSNCDTDAMNVVTSRRLSPKHWPRQIAVWLETGSNPQFLVTLADNPLMLVKSRGDRFCNIPIPIHGGYKATDDGSVVLLVRQNAPFTHDPYRDCLCLIEPRSRVRSTRLRESECILDEDWPRFLSAPDGHEFAIGKRSWRKLSRAEIDAVVRSRKFGASSPVRHRRKAK
jgi:hypothetical protein